MIVNSTELRNDFEDIRSIWSHGDDVHIQRMSDWGSPNNPGYSAIAEYIAKERGERPLGARMWNGSRNLKKPVIETCWVQDNAIIEPPAGSVVIERENKITEYGSYSYCEYIMPKTTKPPQRRQRDTNRQRHPDRGGRRSRPGTGYW
jgi:hypothetical protein